MAAFNKIFMISYMDKVRKYFFILSILLLLLIIAACSQQAPTAYNQQAEKVIQVQEESKSKLTPSVPSNAQETQTTEKTTQETQPAEQNTVTQPETASDTVEMNVIAKRFEFDPSTIKVKQGQKVILHIKSLDVTHGFALPDYKINENLEPGKTVTVEFVADKKGTFTFFCSVYCGSGHRSMKGTLIVE